MLCLLVRPCVISGACMLLSLSIPSTCILTKRRFCLEETTTDCITTSQEQLHAHTLAILSGSLLVPGINYFCQMMLQQLNSLFVSSICCCAKLHLEVIENGVAGNQGRSHLHDCVYIKNLYHPLLMLLLSNSSGHTLYQMQCVWELLVGLTIRVLLCN